MVNPSFPIVWRIVIRFPRAAVALPFVAPICWTGSKNEPYSESCRKSAGCWYLFSIQQFRGIYRLVRYLHPPFVDKVCRYMQQGNPVQKPRALRSYAGDYTESLQWSVAINKRGGSSSLPG
jgi:hypothetical protein